MWISPAVLDTRANSHQRAPSLAGRCVALCKAGNHLRALLAEYGPEMLDAGPPEHFFDDTPIALKLNHALPGEMLGMPAHESQRLIDGIDLAVR
jgi:hypothetical protein